MNACDICGHPHDGPASLCTPCLQVASALFDAPPDLLCLPSALPKPPPQRTEVLGPGALGSLIALAVLATVLVAAVWYVVAVVAWIVGWGS